MRIAVCDDETEIRKMLAEKIQKVYPQADLSLYESGEELLLADGDPDILLLDIQLSGKNWRNRKDGKAGTNGRDRENETSGKAETSRQDKEKETNGKDREAETSGEDRKGGRNKIEGMDGMAAAREFRKHHKNTILIFVTALEEYVFQAFDVGAFHYLVKPFADAKFEEVLRNAAAQCEELKSREAAAKREAPSLLVTAGGRHVAVRLDDIVYAEVYDRKIILHTLDADIEYYGKMKELEKKAGEDFYRSHRAYLVNFRYVRKYDAAAVYLEKGQALMAKQNYHDFVKCYLKYNQRNWRQ